MAKEFIVYSEKKADFEAQVASGSVDTSQIGIIAETAEFWENGNYHPLADLSGYVTKETADSVYLKLSGGTLTGQVKTRELLPSANLSYNLGSSAYKYNDVFANRLRCNLLTDSGTANGSYSKVLGLYAYAGVRTGNSTYPFAYLEKFPTQAFTVNGETVYGYILAPNETLTYTYNSVERTVTNPNATYCSVFAIINGGDDFCGTTTAPLRKATVLEMVGFAYSYFTQIEVIEDGVQGVVLYSWSKSLTHSFASAKNILAFKRSAGSDHSGNYSVASGYYSVASGNCSVASGYTSVASGYSSVASGVNSVASGYYSVASGNCSVASGANSVASGANSVASGANSVASGAYSVASGNSSVASGNYSVASGNSSVASGAYSVASGYSSVASGYTSVASHDSAKVFATGGKSGRSQQTALGYYNEGKSTTALEVGWGSGDSARKNIFEVDTSGNVASTGTNTATKHITKGGTSSQFVKGDGSLDSKTYLNTDAQSLTDAQKKQVADNLGGNATNGLARYAGGVLPVQKISASDANGLEQTYALPNASDDVKASATGGVLATEDTIMKFSNDLTGVLEATPEEFTFRPSAGDKSIRDESAMMRSIKGNTIVWGQYFDFENGSVEFHLCTGVKTNGVYTVTIPSTNTDNRIFSLPHTIPFNQHIWLAIATVKSDSVVNIAGMATQGFTLNAKCVISALYVATDNRDWRWGLTVPSLETEGTIEVYNYQIFDLTQMFGAGNEPTTVEEFRALFPDSYYPYCEPELRSVTTKAIETVGFNQFNGKYAEVLPNNAYYLGGTYTTIGFTEEIGGTTEDITIPDNKLYTPTKKGYIYATGTNICINLSHSGVRNGEYQPYEKHTRELPEIAKYFPNGMRSAGSIYDEIRYNDATEQWEAVQRVGAVDLGSLSWNAGNPLGGSKAMFYTSSLTNVLDIAVVKGAMEIANIINTKYSPISANSLTNTSIDKAISAFMITPHKRIMVCDTSYTDASAFKTAMSGVMLYYELAEPIITPIEEPIQMDYWVEDFGTEEAISDTPSAPFRADVVYQFNAEGRIRDNSRNIERLEDIANEHTTAIEGKLSKPQVPPAQNSLLMWDGESMGIGDSGVGVAGQAADIANAVTDSVPTSAQVKEYISGIAGPRLSFSSNLLGVGVDETHFDVSNAQKVALNVATQGIINTAQALQKVVTLNGDKELKFPRLWLTDGLISDNGLMYALPQAGDDAIGEADAVLATESYVQTYMANNLPTEVATATPRLLALPQSNLLPANQLVDISQSTTASRITINGFAGSSSGYAYDDVWRLRFAGVSTVLRITPTIYWENGVAPNFTTWAICDLEFRKCPSDAMIGKWTIYK